MHAQYEQSPPTSSFSTTMQVSPPLTTRPATFSPVDPAPMTTTSYSPSRSIKGMDAPPRGDELQRSGQATWRGSRAGGLGAPTTSTPGLSPATSPSPGS